MIYTIEFALKNIRGKKDSDICNFLLELIIKELNLIEFKFLKIECNVLLNTITPDKSQNQTEKSIEYRMYPEYRNKFMINFFPQIHEIMKKISTEQNFNLINFKLQINDYHSTLKYRD